MNSEITAEQLELIRKFAHNEFEMNKIRYFNQLPNYQFPDKLFAQLEKESGDISEKLLREIDGDWIREKAIPMEREFEAEFIKTEPAYKEWAEQDSLEQDFEV
jgi:hypothetical protein